MDQTIAADMIEQMWVAERAGKFDEAILKCRQILIDFPQATEAKISMARSRQCLGQFQAALQQVHEAHQLNPNDAANVFAYAKLLTDLGEERVSSWLFETLIAHRPDIIAARIELGKILLKNGRFEEALPHFINIQQMTPDIPWANVNLGFMHQHLYHFKEAEYFFRRAMALDPNHGEAHYHLSMLLLLLEDFKNGWEEHEKRLWTDRGPMTFPTKPYWEGLYQDIRDKTILIYAEQGIGDTLQFLRFVPLLKGMAAKIMILVQKGAGRLCQEIDGIEQIFEYEGRVAPLPDFDVHCPLLSLPHRFNITVESLPTSPYLTPSKTLETVWREKLGALVPSGTLKVGLVWSGTPNTTMIDGRRSMRLKQMSELGAIDGVSFISLQKHPISMIEARNSPADFPLISSVMDEVVDFADTAALVACLDLVITVDTSMAHLCGGLGAKTWLMLRYDSCWRWHKGEGISLWYPTTQMYRQATPNDWSGVLARIRRDLQQLSRQYQESKAVPC